MRWLWLVLSCSCKDYSLPKPNATGHTVFFYDNIRTSEVCLCSYPPSPHQLSTPLICTSYKPVPPSLESSCVVCCHLQVTSWLAVVVLFFLLLMYVLISIVFCVKCTRKTVAPTIPTSDGESSSDGENESEDMVPIAELEHR